MNVSRTAWRAVFGSCALAAIGVAHAGTVSFTKQTTPAGIYSENWPATTYPYFQMTGGGTVGDFNGDGYQDIFWLGGGQVPDKLFINNGDGTFTDQAASWGIDDTQLGVGACAGDYNADGHLDIYTTSHGLPGATSNTAHRLYRNNGDGTFTNVAAAAGVNTLGTSGAAGNSCAFGDYDLDGDLDLAVTAWLFQSGGNALFRNNGDGTFTEVTTSSILYDLFPVRGLSVRFCDMNGDRYPELLWVGDFGTSKYLINNTDGTFTEATASSNTGQDENGMGGTVGDFNADGLIDWYVSSIWNTSETWGEGNKLYINQGGHIYSEEALPWNADDGGWGWGVCAQDFNHDRLVDLVETNGWNDPGNPYSNDPSYVYVNNGDNTFTRLASAIDHTGQGRGLSTFDYDNDGDRDIVIFTIRGSLDLFRNDLSGPDTNWLRVFLDTRDYPGIAPDGIGAVVEATVGSETLVRPIDGGSNYLSISELSAHFGLGDAATVDELVVRWPDGRVTTRTGVPANQTITLTPACDGDVDDSNEVNVNDIGYVIFRLGDTGTPGSVDGDADGNGVVNTGDISYVIFRLGGC